MSAAKKALDALDAAGKATPPGPLSTIDVNYIAACRHADRPLYTATHAAYIADVRYAVAAVNLASPLAAVARAAMARPWITCDEHGNEVGCHGCNAKPWNAWIERKSHDERCRFAKLDAALDALEAAAKEVTT